MTTKNHEIKNQLFMILAFCLLCFLSCKKSEKAKMIEIAETYEEPSGEEYEVSSDWSAVPTGLQASLVSLYKRYTKGEIPIMSEDKKWSSESWKGEKTYAQFALWSNDPINKVQVDITDFVSETGMTITKDNAEINFVKYVITDVFGQGCDDRRPEDYPSSMVTDVLDPVTSFQVVAKETRPFWVIINVPSAAEAGNYKSTLTIHAEGQPDKNFEMQLHVIDKTLPKGTDWKFHLDLWQNPYAVARIHMVAPWSQEHWNLLRPIMKRLADAGQKVITVSINKRPWGGQTFDQFESMIEWKKKKDGSWAYDFTIFDDWVQFMMDLGVKKQINCYSMVPWGNELYYFDEGENKEVKVMAIPGSPEYIALWTPFLKAFQEHLKEKGWNTITSVAMDERKPEEMKAMFALITKIIPEFGVALADNHKSYQQYPNILKDVSVAFGDPMDPDDLQRRREKGYISTFYVCCADPYLNTFTFSPPIEGVITGWYTTAADFDGFLRWAYNSWTEKPLLDSRFRKWAAGDTYLVYPDNRTSIRFEMLRDGIEDAEKIRLLREKFVEEGKQEELDELNATVLQFNTKIPLEDPEGTLIRAKEKLNRLAKK